MTDLHRDLLEATSCGVAFLDDLTHIRAVNSSFAAMLGYGVDELLGRPVADVVTLTDREAAAALCAGASKCAELHLVAKDGAEQLVAVTADPVAGRGGTVLVLDRPRPRGAAADRAVGVLSRASHDLRSPLHVILGYAELLRSDRADSRGDEHDEYTSEIVACGRDMLRLLDEMAAFAKAQREAEEADRPVA